MAKKIDVVALELGIPEGTAIFLEIGENEDVSSDFMRGFAKSLIVEGLTPGFKANTDARFAFDREFSRGMQTDKDVFAKCLIWAVAPVVKEYDGITTSHLIHPDNWMPYAPSGITRNEIAVGSTEKTVTRLKMMWAKLPPSISILSVTNRLLWTKCFEGE